MKKTIVLIIMAALLALCLHQPLLADVIETKIHSVSSENPVAGRDAFNTVNGSVNNGLKPWRAGEWNRGARGLVGSSSLTSARG